MFYKKLDVNCFQEVQRTVVPYITNFVTKDINKNEEKFFYNFISDENLIKFKQDIPELFKCIQKELESEIILMSYICVYGPDEVPIHTDANNTMEIRTRLNWPILNCEGAATVFYKKNSDDVQGVVRTFKSGMGGSEYRKEDCYEIDRYILNTPTLMNVKELHGIDILTPELPRILLTMRLSNENQVYQKYF